jgi:hypothetical protein
MAVRAALDPITHNPIIRETGPLGNSVSARIGTPPDRPCLLLVEES